MWPLAAAAAPPAVRCDHSALERGQQAVEQVAPEHLVPLSVQALLEACRWPEPVAAALQRMAFDPRAGAADFTLATAAPATLEAVCPGAVKGLGVLASSPLEEGRRHLYGVCRPAFATEAEWVEAPGLLVAPLLLPAWLGASGVPPESVRVWGRALAGISDRAEDHPIRAFGPLFELP